MGIANPSIHTVFRGLSLQTSPFVRCAGTPRLCKSTLQPHEYCFLGKSGLRSSPRYLRSSSAFPTIPCEKECAMTIFDPPPRHGRVIDMQCGSLARVLGVLFIGLLVVIFLFSAVARVDSGAVGVLTLFGRVTGEALPER